MYGLLVVYSRCLVVSGLLVVYLRYLVVYGLLVVYSRYLVVYLVIIVVLSDAATVLPRSCFKACFS